MMGKDRYSWLTASCYFPMNKWHFLLKKIGNFYRDINDREVKATQISFDHTNGDNLRLLLLVDNNALDKIRVEMDVYFACFFCGYPNESIKTPIAGIHLPYPSAILRFDLNLITYDKNESIYYQARKIISNLIIDILSEDEIDHVMVITFHSYLNISLIKVFISKLLPISKAEFIRDYKKNLVNEITTIDAQLFSSLEEITADIFNANKFEGELIWLNNWIDFLNFYFDEVQGDAWSNSKFEVVLEMHNELRAVISKQLHVSDDTALQLERMILLSLDKENS